MFIKETHTRKRRVLEESNQGHERDQNSRDHEQRRRRAAGGVRVETGQHRLSAHRHGLELVGGGIHLNVHVAGGVRLALGLGVGVERTDQIGGKVECFLRVTNILLALHVNFCRNAVDFGDG